MTEVISQGTSNSCSVLIISDSHCNLTHRHHFPCLEVDLGFGTCLRSWHGLERVPKRDKEG